MFHAEPIPDQKVLEDAGCRFKLPVEADGAGDRPGRIGRTDVVRIGDAGRRYRQGLAHGRRATYRQPARRRVVESGHEIDSLIRELQPLDVGEAVGAIENVSPSHTFGDVTCFWWGCAGSAGLQMSDRGDAGDGVGGDGVVGGDVPEIGGVEAGMAGHQLAYDNELAGVVGAVHHQRLQRLHAVEAGDLSSGAIEVLAHADARVEPHVAVEQIVAAAALEDVAAVAAQDDVALVELVVGRAEYAVRASRGAHIGEDVVRREQDAVRAGQERKLGEREERPQARDEVEVGERAALAAGDGELRRAGIVAAYEIVVERPGQALDLPEAGEDLPIDRHWDVQLAHVRVHDDAGVGLDDGILEGDPVEAGAPDEPLAGGAGGEHNIVAALAEHAVVAEAAREEDVVAVAQVLAQGICGVADHFLAAALDPVVAEPGYDLDVLLVDHDEVVAAVGEGLRFVRTGDQEVLARAADDDVAIVAVEGVVAAPADEDVIAGAAEQHVVAGAAVQPVVAGVTVERVLA